MTIARAQMYRQLYQLGGIGTLPMDFGQPLQVPQQPQTNFSSAQNITMNPLASYGQPQLGNAGGTPLMMAGGGISRLGYQEGGMGMDQEPMMQPQMQQPPLEGIMGAMPQDSSMMQQEGGTEQTALLTIIQLLIEQGVPPEKAQELAMQILQVFAQGGQPAVEEFANQLEQQEGMQEPVMMARGGIIVARQGAKFGKVFKAITGGIGSAVKGVSNAIKSVAKSPIGMIALSIAAPYAIGAIAPGFATLGGTGFMGAALRAGISNLAIQGITTGKINPKQALMAAVGGGIAQGVFGPAGGVQPQAGDAMYTDYGSVTSSPLSSGVVGDLPQPQMTSGSAFATGVDVPDPTRMNLDLSGAGTNYNPAGSPLTESQRTAFQSQFAPNPLERGIAQVKQFGTNLMTDPLKTLGNVGSSIYQSAKDNAVPLAIGFGASALAQQPGESDEEYSARAARDPQVAAYITRYGGGIGLRSPSFYSMEKAVDPFAGTSLAASTNPFYPQGYSSGGRIGYAEGTSFEKQSLIKKGYGDMIKNMTESEILKLYDSVMGTFSRRFQAEGTMPMGKPRRNPAGIMELDYRKEGGFVPPVGIKEKADDIPAMLSNNEFVFTADAVRNAGGGDVDRGAQRMYSLMKNLENGGRV